jgi:hypothetical protein
MFDMLEVILKFQCSILRNVHPHASEPQLVVGRVACLTSSLTSPYSCQQCALYRIDCFLRQKSTAADSAGLSSSSSSSWQRVFTEVRAVSFELRDPDDPGKAIQVPGKALAVKYFNLEVCADFDEETCVQPDATPSISGLLDRCGLTQGKLSDIRIREWCVEQNSEVGIFGIVAPNGKNSCDDDVLRMTPVSFRVLHIYKVM